MQFRLKKCNYLLTHTHRFAEIWVLSWGFRYRNTTAFVTAIIDIKYTIIVYILLTIKDLTMLTKDKDFQKEKSTEL